MDSRMKINKNESKILNMIGRMPNVSSKKIARTVGYKRIDTVSRKLKKLKEKDIIRGPYYDINLSAIGKNQLYSIYSIITCNPEDHDLIFKVLKAIPGCRLIFPTTDLDRFFVYFQSNHYRHVGMLMKILYRKKLIQYELFTSRYKWIKRNPNFFGQPIPTSKRLLSNCRIPDISYGNIHSRVKWNTTDLTVMQYLQVWSDSPVEIARKEYKWYGKFLSYDQIRCSMRKIKKSGIIESKDYHISPLPRAQCSTILLLLQSNKKTALLKIMENFGKGCRLYRSYTLAGNTAIMFCWTFPEASTNMLDIFDKISFLQARMYFLRSHKTPYLCSSSFEPELFNSEDQRWKFPYLRAKKRIEAMIMK